MMRSNGLIAFDATQIFHELDFTRDGQLLRAVTSCIEAQRAAGTEALRSVFRPDPQAESAVSAQVLEAIMASRGQVSDIRTDRTISNCLVFNSTNLQDAVLNQSLLALRRQVDAVVTDRLRRVFQEGQHIAVRDSGHFWYPPGGYMGWHTNWRTPGWRFYINYCEEPGKSFFRYRDPDSGAITTSIDQQWNFRLFRITRERPLWHAIASDTNRFSLGYTITSSPRRTLPRRIWNRLERMITV